MIHLEDVGVGHLETMQRGVDLCGVPARLNDGADTPAPTTRITFAVNSSDFLKQIE